MDKRTFTQNFGLRLKAQRQSMGISQSELASICLKDRQYIHRLENGSITPTIYTVFLICKELQIKIEKLFPDD